MPSNAEKGEHSLHITLRSGSFTYKTLVFQVLKSISISLIPYIMVSTQVFLVAIVPSHLQTVPYHRPIMLHTRKLLIENLNEGATLLLAPKAQVESLIGPFQSSPLSLIENPGKPNKLRAIQFLFFKSYLFSVLTNHMSESSKYLL